MGNMIAEFGSMFGGGSEHGLEQEEVLGKVSETVDEENAESIVSNDSADQDEGSSNSEVQSESEETGKDDIDGLVNASSVEETDEVKVDEQQHKEKKKSNVKADETLDEGIDDLMDSLDLSD